MDAPTVLVVDDEADLRTLVRFTLEPQGYRVLEASSQSEVEGVLADASVGIAILDLGLGGQESGLDVCKHLLSCDPPPVVIMVTGSVLEADRRASLDLGATAFLTKPYSPLELLDLVRRFLPAAG